MTEEIRNMSKEEVINAASDVENRLEEIRKCIEPYSGKNLEDTPKVEAERIQKLLILTQQLINAKADLRKVAFYKYHIFIM